jgi:hypothetical protein
MSLSPAESPLPGPGGVPVPRTLADLLSPDWLTSALSGSFPGLRVSAVTPGPVISRVATNARFRVDCAGGLPSGLSAHLCAKGYFSPEGWPSRVTSRFEVLFYRHLAARTGIRTLRSVYADIDAETGHGVVITEDVAEQGATFLDATSPYTVEQAAQSLGQYAQLHAATWGDRQAGTAADWLKPRLDGTLRRGIPEISHNFTGTDIGAGVPAAVRDAARLRAAYEALVEESRIPAPWPVIHGDAHIGNVYLDGTGRPALLDWQTVQRGPWYLDVGYHIASALTVEDRRRAERDLVAHYLDELRGHGVEVPARPDPWLGIRRGILRGFYMWGITMKVRPAVTSVMLHRLGTAAEDHDAYGAVA